MLFFVRIFLDKDRIFVCRTDSDLKPDYLTKEFLTLALVTSTCHSYIGFWQGEGKTLILIDPSKMAGGLCWEAVTRHNGGHHDGGYHEPASHLSDDWL